MTMLPKNDTKRYSRTIEICVKKGKIWTELIKGCNNNIRGFFRYAENKRKWEKWYAH